MSITSNTEDDTGSDFLHFFQKFKFQEDSKNFITSAGSKRTQLILNYFQSLKSDEENATTFLLENDLGEYVAVVDNKTGLNNYAQYIKSASCASRNSVSDCNKWSSSLESHSFPDINCKLSHSSNNIEKNIQKFYRNLMNNSNCPEESLSNVRISDFERTNDMCATRNEIRYPNNNIETLPSKPSTTSSAAFIFKKPNMVPPRVQHNSNFNNKAEMKEQKTSNDSSCGFRTAKVELKIQNVKKFGNKASDSNQSKESFSVKRSLGGRTRTVNSKFIPPIKNEENEKNSNDVSEEETCDDERLKNLDPKMIELIKNEIMDHGNPITWDDIAGLQFAKTTIQEIVVWPLLRPDIFTGLRRPPKGILLFGPPGTGKTLIGKCIASQSSSTFFSISASSLTSKWIGDSEKLVRTLFAVARCYQPAVIFIDEIDSLLSQRSETEHESSRRIKTEFLVQLDGATTHEDDRILVIGATNRPQELDEAARRRLVKRLYIPLPEYEARCQIVNRLMKTEKNELSEEDVHKVAELTDGYSGADMKNLCQEASLGPIRSIDFTQIGSIESHEVRPVNLSDFISALKVVRSSVSPSDLKQYLEWDKIYGSSGN